MGGAHSGSGFGTGTGGNPDETNALLKDKEDRDRSCGDCSNRDAPTVTTNAESHKLESTAGADAYSNPNEQASGQLHNLGHNRVQTSSGFQGYERTEETSISIKEGEDTPEQVVDETQYYDLDAQPHEKGDPLDGADHLFSTNPETGLTAKQAADRLKVFGYNELPEKEKNICYLLCMEFIKPMAVIVWLAILLELIAACIEYSQDKDAEGHGDIVDVFALLLLQFLNVFVGFFEELKADEAIKKLKQSILPFSTVKRDGKFQEVFGREVVPGDIVKVIHGAGVAADGTVVGAECSIDESAVNGESVAAKKKKHDPATMSRAVLMRCQEELEMCAAKLANAKGSEVNAAKVKKNEVESRNKDLFAKVKMTKVYMGTMCQSGESEIVVTATGIHTEMGKTAKLMTTDNSDSSFELLLDKMLWVLVIMGVVVNIVIVSYLLTLRTPPPILTVLSFAVVLLVASIPIALRVVCVTTLALGTRELSNEGAIVSKINAVEEIASMSLLCSDKTGTLTQNKMAMCTNGFEIGWRMTGVSYDNLLQHAALAAKWNEKPIDALDTLILRRYCPFAPIQDGLNKFYFSDPDRFEPFNPSAKRTAAIICCRNKYSDTERHSLSGDKVPVVTHEVKLGKGKYIVKEEVVANAAQEQVAELEELSEPRQLQMPNGDEECTIVNYHPDGEIFEVTKGAPKIILDLCWCEGEPEPTWVKEFKDNEQDLAKRGIRTLAVATRVAHEDKAAKNTNKWRMLGILSFKDPSRPDSLATIDMAYRLGVQVKMITGDNHLIGQQTAEELKMEQRPNRKLQTINIEKNQATNVTTPLASFEIELLAKLALDEEKKCPLANKKLEKDQLPENLQDYAGKTYGDLCDDASAFAGVFPEHKYLIVAALKQKLGEGHPVGMTGDGVNDAPALHVANIGIAVEGATEAATAAADIVLTEPGLSAVITAIVVSRKIFTRMKNFVVYRIACTLQLLFFFLIACLAYNPQDYCGQDEFFFLPVIALVTIVILNDGTIISVAFDNVKASKLPEEWNMPVLCIASSVVGLVALVSSIILLHVGLECSGNFEASRYLSALKAGGAIPSDVRKCFNHDTNFLTESGMDVTFGMNELHYNGIKTMMYLKIALSDYLSLFNSRSHSWFFSTMPSIHVILAAVFATTVSSLLSRWWFLGADMDGISWPVIGFVWIYTIIWGFIQDCCKVFTYWVLAQIEMDRESECLDEDEIKRVMKGPKEQAKNEAESKKHQSMVVKEYVDWKPQYAQER